MPGPVRCAAASAKGKLYLVAGEMGNSLYEVDLGSGRAEKLGMDHLHGDGCGMGLVPSAYGSGEGEEELVIVGGTWGLDLVQISKYFCMVNCVNCFL